jgi:Arc/MetJ family transcription regulator
MSTVKTPVEIDEEALAAAAKVPGTKTKRHAVGAALRETGQRLARMRALVKLGEMTDRANLDCEEYRWGLRKTGPPRR